MQCHVLDMTSAKAKRDRWASSSSSEDDERKPSKTIKQDVPTEHDSLLLNESNHFKSHMDGAPNTKATLPVPGLPLHNPLLSGCRSVYNTFERIERVSEGSYGIVWKARDLSTGNLAALKQIKFQGSASSTTTYSGGGANDFSKDGFPVSALREINVLLALQHESIVSVQEMVVGDAPDQVYMVMEFFECDLKDALRNSSTGGPLAQAELKGILQQILAGTQYMHESRFIHRDLKPSNILVKLSDSGRIALADFGLARRYENPPRHMTLPVVTLWYRSPELLFGETRYGSAVDMWSIGCIMGELIQSGGSLSARKAGVNDDDDEDDGNAILKGQGELDQIDQIFSLVGVPNEHSWPSFAKLPHANLLRWKSIADADILLPKQFPVASVGLSSHQTFLDANGYQLLRGLLTLDPSQRLTSPQAAQHAYFREGVAPQIPCFFASTTNP